MNKAYKIFIAEDEDTLLEIYSERFKRAGFIPTGFKNGLDLLTGISSETPDIILLDIQMPEMNGFDVLESIHKNFADQGKQNVLVIVWSNSGSDADVRRTKELGASLFLKKIDFKGDDLVEKVRAMAEEKLG